MDPDRPMYRWREMTARQRAATLEYRRRRQLPWHSLPHYENESGFYLLTAACYEHKPHVGASPQRMADFEADLLKVLHAGCSAVFAWVLLPNHYHSLVRTPAVKPPLAALGKLHGSSSFRWNGEENVRGRHVWCGAAETAIKSERHFWATLNYVLHNAVRHGYVTRWQDWPYSNAADYLATTGRAEAQLRWREYPLGDYGKDWDPPDL